MLIDDLSSVWVNTPAPQSHNISILTLQDDTTMALFERCLAFLYSGEGADEGVAVLFDGFQSSPAAKLQKGQLNSLDRLREVSLVTSPLNRLS